ncbi:MAG: hypothetical protein K0S65_5985, partial [Labilithrix sp.]|nr:hypothetical protein [Labilithrix sp.]
MPSTRLMLGDWNVPNPGNCGGSPCPWHGTMVASAAMGTLDDGNGAAGPAAPVGELVAVPFQSDFYGIMTTLTRVIGGVANAMIINISSSFELDLGWDIAVKAACLGLCPSPSEVVSGITAAVVASNRLIFASAGNQGKDVDNAGDRIEGSTTLPCESVGVVCVGGMAHDSTRVDSGSNFGSKTGEDTVDIYGPFWTWVGSDPDNPTNHARLKAGTSFSSPFVAGAAALVWASRPSLTAPEVWGILRDTAHVGGVHDRGGNQRRVNAFGAVARVLGGAPPVLTLATSGATAPVNREWFVTASVTDDGNLCPPSACPLTFDPAPARVVGNTAFYRFDSVGPRTITVTARDPVEQAVTATALVEANNTPPVVAITAPSTGASIAQGVPVQILGSAHDVNEGPGPDPGVVGCNWTSSNPADVLTNACNFTHSFTTQGSRTLTLRATDTHGATSSASVTITVTAPPTNYPPTIGVTSRSPSTPNYSGGYSWETAFTLSTNAVDGEGDTPITYTWKVTSFRPNTTTIYADSLTIGSSATLSWTPSATAGLLGAFGDFGNDCYNGQTVRVRVEARDNLGNTSTKTLPDFKVFRCILE